MKPLEHFSGFYVIPESGVMLPPKVLCFGIVFDVVYVGRDELGGNEGDVDWNTCTIRIADDLALQARYSTLWHEYWHIVEWTFGWTLGETKVNTLSAFCVNHKLPIPIP